MYGRRLKGAIAVLALLALLIGSGAALAKKPTKPPPEPADPAITYAKFVWKGSNASSYVMVMDDDGSNQSILDQPGSGAIWTPEDPPRVVYWGLDDAGDQALLVIDADGTDRTLIAKASTIGTWSQHLACCPVKTGDTYRIVFRKKSPDRADLWTINLDGTGLTQITDTEDIGECEATWSPDGDRLAFRIIDWNQQGAGDLWAIYDYSDGSYTEYQHTGGMEGKWVQDPSWAKTGDKIVWSVYDATAEDYDLWVVDISDPEDPSPTRLTNTSDTLEWYANWSPDDSKIVLISSEERRKGWTHSCDVIDSDGSNRTTIVDDMGDGACRPVWRW